MAISTPNPAGVEPLPNASDFVSVLHESDRYAMTQRDTFINEATLEMKGSEIQERLKRIDDEFARMATVSTALARLKSMTKSAVFAGTEKRVPF